VIAVCAYFNPFGSERRENVFRRFRTEMESRGVSVLCVEQRLDGVRSVIQPGDIAVSGGDLLWQKEALLQLGIDHALVQGAERVLITDADIVFDANEAIGAIAEAFEKFDYFQAYETIVLEYSEEPRIKRSALSYGGVDRFGLGHCGSCWGARASVLRELRLFAHALMGGGDVAMTHLVAALARHGGASSRFEDLCIHFSEVALWPNALGALLEWGRATKASLTGMKVGYAAGVSARALDHGSFTSRKYEARYRDWRGANRERGPRPNMDFGLDGAGLLTWRTKPNPWESAVERYLKERARP